MQFTVSGFKNINLNKFSRSLDKRTSKLFLGAQNSHKIINIERMFNGHKKGCDRTPIKNIHISIVE